MRMRMHTRMCIDIVMGIGADKCVRIHLRVYIHPHINIHVHT